MAANATEARGLIDRTEALLGDEPKCRFCPVDYYLAAATACAAGDDLTDAHAFLARADRSAALWRHGSWAAAVAEARAAVLSAEGHGEAATQALRHAITGYTAAGQHLNEARARRKLTAPLAGPERAR
jgi:hypothetical protein